MGTISSVDSFLEFLLSGMDFRELRELLCCKGGRCNRENSLGCGKNLGGCFVHRPRVLLILRLCVILDVDCCFPFMCLHFSWRRFSFYYGEES